MKLTTDFIRIAVDTSRRDFLKQMGKVPFVPSMLQNLSFSPQPAVQDAEPEELFTLKEMMKGSFRGYSTPFPGMFSWIRDLYNVEVEHILEDYEFYKSFEEVFSDRSDEEHSLEDWKSIIVTKKDVVRRKFWDNLVEIMKFQSKGMDSQTARKFRKLRLERFKGMLRFPMDSGKLDVSRQEFNDSWLNQESEKRRRETEKQQGEQDYQGGMHQFVTSRKAP